MKVCTYNVNSIKARKELVLDWLEHRGHDIDVLCFQELKTVDEGFPSAGFEDLGYRCFVFGQKAYNGVAICTRIASGGVQKGFGSPEWDEQKRILSARIDGVTIINIYAPHGGLRGEDKFVYKQRWYGQLIQYLNENHSPNDSLVILGDFNVAHKDIDVYSPEALKDSIGTMPEERRRFQDLLDSGLTDVMRFLQPDKIQFTWWDYMGGAVWKDRGMRIDYILSTKNLLDRIKNIEVDLWPRKRRQPTPSDHAPLVADLQL